MGSSGQFKPGQSGNLAGKPKGARRRVRMNTKSSAKPPAKPYEPTPRETEVIQKMADHLTVAPSLKVEKKGTAAQILIDHPDQATGYALLMDAVGTSDPIFLELLLTQLGNAGSQGRELDERGLNFMLSVVSGVEPKDQMEAMLAAQMAAVHMATMTFARRLAHVENIPQQDSAERAFNKLARTYTTQMEALKRYRTGGQQTVTVEHVTVTVCWPPVRYRLSASICVV